jgi:5-methylcytosine-specific restriction protein A
MDQRSEKATEYRRLYRTKRWLAERADHLSRNPLCAMCLPRTTAATVCDHVDPRDKDDPELFFTGKKQSLCKAHHDSTKQREEKRGHMIGSDESGAPLDPRHPWNKG